MPDSWSVYIASLEGGRYTVGMTHFEPVNRGLQHQAGSGGRFTKGVRVVRILWSERHSSSAAARKREIQLKRWSHGKKEALISGDIARLKALARARRRT